VAAAAAALLVGQGRQAGVSLLLRQPCHAVVCFVLLAATLDSPAIADGFLLQEDLAQDVSIARGCTLGPAAVC
jgi:hypothetical protein